MLTDDFAWVPYRDTHDLRNGVRLDFRGEPVAVVAQTSGGQWFAAAAYFLSPPQRPTTLCHSIEQGRKWAERWAADHVDALERRDRRGRTRPSVT